jgi:hypothetical protein
VFALVVDYDYIISCTRQKARFIFKFQTKKAATNAASYSGSVLFPVNKYTTRVKVNFAFGVFHYFV